MINSTRKLCSLLGGEKYLDKLQVVFGSGPKLSGVNTLESSSASLMKPVFSYPAEEGCSACQLQSIYREKPELLGVSQPGVTFGLLKVVFLISVLKYFRKSFEASCWS